MNVDGMNLCIGCMHILDDSDECPYCHMRIKNYKPGPRYLLPGTVLAERYVLGKSLGSGNFGITYLAWDKILLVPVAVKEYYPADIVSRDIIRGTDLNIYVNDKTEYDKKLNKFIKEARCLARFSNLDGIVSVQDFFYANNTAYIIMKYIEGDSVKKYVKAKGKMDGQEVLRLMKPILGSLCKIHSTGLLHRDISPDNILFQEEEKLVLIDFGSARVQDAVEQKSMTVLFKRGFSPEEQYRPRGKQGPWSDIYAICATMYFMLTGKVPLDAIERMAGEILKPLADMPDINIPIKAKEAIMKGLNVKASDRYQTVSELMSDIYDGQEIAVKSYKYGKNRKTAMLICFLFMVFIFAGIIMGFFKKSNKTEKENIPEITPYASSAPYITEEPIQPVQPTIIPQAEETDKPVKTEKPKKTAKPKKKETKTQEPKKTEAPQKTYAPKKTQEPKKTEAPKSSKKTKRSDGFIGIID